MAVGFKLDSRDRDAYGGPESVSFDRSQLDDLPYSVSGAWDRELKAATGKGIYELLLEYAEAATRSARSGVGTADSTKAIVWLARQMAGVESPPFKAFDIRWGLVRVVEAQAEADANPPASGSSEPPSEDAPSPTA